MMLVVFGVAGSGKSTVGRLLSEALDVPFYDADDFHPVANVEKMTAGQALDDADREPWLETLADELARWERQGGAVLACSALKQRYRETLGSKCAGNIHWVLLRVSEAVLAGRLASREGHFMGAGLLASQLEALEVPADGWEVDAELSPHEVVNDILNRLQSE